MNKIIFSTLLLLSLSGHATEKPHVIKCTAQYITPDFEIENLSFETDANSGPQLDLTLPFMRSTQTVTVEMIGKKTDPTSLQITSAAMDGPVRGPVIFNEGEKVVSLGVKSPHLHIVRYKCRIEAAE